MIVLAGGITHPKKITCNSTDGRSFLQVVKGGEDPRSDSISSQLFCVINVLLHGNRSCRRRKLEVRTYKVIPLHPQVCGGADWFHYFINLFNKSRILAWSLHTQHACAYTHAHSHLNTRTRTLAHSHLHTPNRTYVYTHERTNATHTHLIWILYFSTLGWSDRMGIGCAKSWLFARHNIRFRSISIIAPWQIWSSRVDTQAVPWSYECCTEPKECHCVR